MPAPNQTVAVVVGEPLLGQSVVRFEQHEIPRGIVEDLAWPPVVCPGDACAAWGRGDFVDLVMLAGVVRAVVVEVHPVPELVEAVAAAGNGVLPGS